MSGRPCWIVKTLLDRAPLKGTSGATGATRATEAVGATRAVGAGSGSRPEVHN